MSPKLIRVSIIIISSISICIGLAFTLHGLGQKMDLLPFLAVCVATGCVGILSGWFVDQAWLKSSQDGSAVTDSVEFSWAGYKKPILYPAFVVVLLVMLGIWLS
jgi:hypothetical protein